MTIGYKRDEAKLPSQTPRGDVVRGIRCCMMGLIPMALAFLLCAGVSYVMGW